MVRQLAGNQCAVRALMQVPPTTCDKAAVLGIISAELSRSLKVLGRGRDTQKPVGNRSGSGCAGLSGYFVLGFVRFEGPCGPQIDEFRPES